MKKIWPLFTPACPVCGFDEAAPLFKKKGASGREFQLVKCRSCGLEFIHPKPSAEELNECYQSDYFTKRTDRGYDNYFSPEIRGEIERVIKLNLKGLSFNPFEFSMPGEKRSLDIGCAAGYFVNYIASRGWNAQGIEVSKPCVEFARNKLRLNVIDADYLETRYTEKFDLITLWATIEHLPDPRSVIRKIFNDLREGGMLYVSTCRTGGFFQRMTKSSWRYYNFPEHVYFFSLPNLRRLLADNGFKVKKCFTYGSGFGKPKSFMRRIADFAARHFGMGDMMVIAAIKDRNKLKG
jgi:2-polyprenyl-3-methyl-5-hydroxy-6-metoxy-1,4-benzoquinol methylase